MAVEMAIGDLPDGSEIKAFLKANCGEVKDMCLTEYDAERENKILKKQYLEEGADRMASLVAMLLKAGRIDDLQKASTDASYREKLFKEFGID